MSDDLDRRKIAESIEYLRRNGLSESRIAIATGLEAVEVGMYSRCETPIDVNFCITVTDLDRVVKSLTERSSFWPLEVTDWFDRACRHRAELTKRWEADGVMRHLPGVSRLKLISQSPLFVMADAAQEELAHLDARATAILVGGPSR